MLTEKAVVDDIRINEAGQMSIRTATVVEKDGVEIARSFHRKVIEPGDNVDGEDPRVKLIANADWTPARKNAFATAKAARAAREALLGA